jgi:malonyl-CoA/methylmalonyl-CoA synthetase
MPSVEIRLWDLATNTLITDLETPGEVQVRGVGITKEYWRLPDATAKEFIDGWFKTGDVAVRSSVPGPEHGMYRILGRSSVDIIKSGGEKISAIEIERAILELPGMEDAAVVGVPDEEWGQIVSNTVWTCGQDELLVWVPPDLNLLSSSSSF